MPFTKTGHGKYRSPSGRTYSAAQVRLYHATGGFKKSAMRKMTRLKKKKASTGGTKHVVASEGGSL